MYLTNVVYDETFGERNRKPRYPFGRTLSPLLIEMSNFISKTEIKHSTRIYTLP